MDRITSIKHLNYRHFEVMIVGGGNSGASVAACLAHHLGNKVALVDRNDFASGTSQHSSNLIWGGIKYLENGEFSLVKKLCKSRNELIEKFPGLVEEIRFYCPHEKTAKHSLLKLIIGTWFYWLWGNFFTRKPKSYSLKSLDNPNAIPIKKTKLDGIFEYSDAYLPENDARFVFNFIKTAHQYGATVANYVELKKASFHQSNSKNRSRGYWELELYDRINNKSLVATTTVLINAAGAYVDPLNLKNQITTKHVHCFSKGVHIIVKRLFSSHKVLTFFSDDDRLFFAIPMGPCTCIGTTDNLVDKPEAKITKEDISFILSNINRLLKLDTPLSEKDIISTRAGVRPLVITRPLDKENTQESTNTKSRKWFNISRKHVIEQNDKNYLSIFGGKLTDCINIAQEARSKVLSILVGNNPQNKLVSSSNWIPEHKSLRIKFIEDFYSIVKTELAKESSKRHKSNASPDKVAQFWGKRLWRRYGSEVFRVVEEIRAVKPFLKEFIPNSDFSEGEIRFQIKNEMVMCQEDLLRRRSMLALIVKEDMLSKSSILKKLPKNISSKFTRKE